MAITQSIHVWRGRPADNAMLVSDNICYHFFIAKARRTALPPIPPKQFVEPWRFSFLAVQNEL